MVVNFIFNIRKDSEEQSRISLELIHSRTWRSWERPWRALVSRMNFLSSVPHCSCHDLLRDLIFNYIETVWAAVLESRGLDFTVCSEILLLLPHVSFVVANRSTLWILCQYWHNKWSSIYTYMCLYFICVGTDEQAIINLLGSRSSKQRVPLLKAYKTSYGKVTVPVHGRVLKGQFRCLGFFTVCSYEVLTHSYFII